MSETLNRTAGFLIGKGDKLDPIITRGVRDRLIESRDRFTEYLTDENACIRASRAATARKKMLRERLVAHHIKPISLLASAKLRTAEEFKALVARGALRLPDTALVQMGFGIARAADRHADTFVSAGLAPDFIARLVEATEALKSGITAQGVAVAHRLKATAGIKQEFRAARTTLALIDTMMESGLAHDDEMRAEWRSLSRVRAQPVASQGDATSHSPAPADAAAANGATPTPSTPSDVLADVAGPHSRGRWRGTVGGDPGGPSRRRSAGDPHRGRRVEGGSLSTIRRITDSRGRAWKAYVEEASGSAARPGMTDNAINVVVRMERSDERHVDVKLRGRSFADMSDEELVAELEKALAKRQSEGGGT